MSLISIVVPVFNEHEGIQRFHETAVSELNRKMPGQSVEFIYVNDGSTDGTAEELFQLHKKDPKRICVLNFLKNFGQVAALLAGLKYAQGDCAVIISADLQDPPGLIPEMFSHWQKGHALVVAARQSRQDDLFSRIASKIFYALMSRFSNPHIPKGGFDFFLMDRRLINLVKESDERNCFLQGLVLWPGFKPHYLYYERQKRTAGQSHWNFVKKFKYFIDGFTAYSLFPIRLIAVTGCVLFALGFFTGLIALTGDILHRHMPSAGRMIFLAVCLLGGLQMMGLGVLGEYLWRTLEESRKRPLFLIDSVHGKEEIK